MLRPSADEPNLILPLRPRAATSAALRRYHDDRSPKERLVGLAAQALGRTGAIAKSGGEVRHLEPFALVEKVAAALGEDELIPAIGLGPPRRNRKPVVQLIRPDGVSVGFAKIGWSDFTSNLIANEAKWLGAVDGRLPSGMAAPAVLHRSSMTFEEASLEIVVTSPLSNSVFSNRPTGLSLDLVIGLARCLGTTVTSLAEMPLLEHWRNGPVADWINVDAIVDRHGLTSVETGFWHGDLTPWNTATNRGISAVWDWEFAGDGRPVGFDLLHMAFEGERRRHRGAEQAAVAHVIEHGSRLLRAIPSPPQPEAVPALIDLYMCELLAREALLAGEGWQPQHLGQLDTHLLDALSARVPGVRRTGESTG